MFRLPHISAVRGGFIALLLMVIAACGNEEQSGEISRGDLPPDLTEAPHFSVEFTPEKGLKYEGRYFGEFPCADCPATEVILELHEGRYQRTIRRIGKEERPIVDRGHFIWDEAGERIELQGGGGSKYLFFNDRLYQLGMDGTQCMQQDGSAFMLMRTNGHVAPIPLKEDAANEATIETDGDAPLLAVDYAGVYRGTLPCADCPGIEVVLELDYDDAYSRTITYLDDESEPIVESGHFIWMDGEERIRLEGSDNFPLLRIFDGGVELLDQEGRTIESRLNYQLLKENEANSSSQVGDDRHNGEKALSYAGLYRGMLPMGALAESGLNIDEDVRIEVNLSDDGDYQLLLLFPTTLADENVEVSRKGPFLWDEQGERITFDGIGEPPLTFVVEEEKLLLQDGEAEYPLYQVSEPLTGENNH